MVPEATKRRAVFLDRDGVINRKLPEGEYVANWQQFEIISTAPQAIASLNEAGIKVAVVTNQRGVALGKLNEKDLAAVHDHMQHTLQAYGAHVDGIFYCPHDDNSCDCRKPRPGLLLQAFAHFREVPSANAVLIGDSLSDIEAGWSAGVRTILVRGSAANDKPEIAKAQILADAVADSLGDAVRRVLGIA